MIIAWVIAWLSLGIWVFLIVGRGFFWLALPRLDAGQGTADFQEESLSVVAVIPARNEEAVIEQSLTSVLDQAFRGSFHVILLDDPLNA